MKTVRVNNTFLGEDYVVLVPKASWRKLQAFQRTGKKFTAQTGLEYFLWAAYGSREDKTSSYLAGSMLGCHHCDFFLGMEELPGISTAERVKYLRVAARWGHLSASYLLLSSYAPWLEKREFLDKLKVCLRADYRLEECYGLLEKWAGPNYLTYLKTYWSQGIMSAGERLMLSYFDQGPEFRRDFKQIARQLNNQSANFSLGVYYHQRLDLLVDRSGRLGHKLTQKALTAYQSAIEQGCLRASWNTCLMHLKERRMPPEMLRFLWHLAAIDYKTAANQLMVYHRENGHVAELKYLARREMQRTSQQIINTQTAYAVFADYYTINKQQPDKAVPYLLAGGKMGHEGCRTALLLLPSFCYTQEVLEFSLAYDQPQLTEKCLIQLYPVDDLTVETLQYSVERGLTSLTKWCLNYIPVSTKVYRLAVEQKYKHLLYRCRRHLNVKVKTVHLALEYQDEYLLRRCFNDLPISPPLVHLSFRLEIEDVPEEYADFRAWYLDSLFEFYRYAPTYFSRWIVGDVARLIRQYLA